MDTTLTGVEIFLLDQLILRMKMHEPINLNLELKKIAEEEKEQLAGKGYTDMGEHKNNVAEYLKGNEFMRTQDTIMYSLSEKGKNLKRQGRYEKYNEWQKDTRSKNKVIIHTIETRGYLDQDEVVKNRRSEQLKRYVIYPAIVVLIILAAMAVAYHFKLMPKIKI